MKKKLIIYVLVSIFLVSGIFISKKHKENQDYIKQQNLKKQIEEGIKKAEKENKKMEELKKYSTPLPNSERIADSNEKTKVIRVENMYNLYKSEFLELEQFIYVEESINNGVNAFSKKLDNESSKRIYGVEQEDYMKLKELFVQAGNINKVVIDENSIVKNESNIKFKLVVSGTSKNIEINIEIVLSDTIKDIKIRWNI